MLYSYCILGVEMKNICFISNGATETISFFTNIIIFLILLFILLSVQCVSRVIGVSYESMCIEKNQFVFICAQSKLA